MSYLTPLIAAYREKGDPEIAAGQKAYLKGRFEFFGLKMPDRRAIDKEFLAENKLPPVEELYGLVREGFGYPYREIHYFVLDLAIRQKKKLSPKHLEMAVLMITHQSWWDTVDLVASHIVGQLVLSYPELKDEVGSWITHEYMWMRRVAILYQLKYKTQTDAERLFQFCEMEAESEEFFIRKAIGWSLREYSKIAPEPVIEFVKKHPELSGLSQREALKHIKKTKKGS